MGTEVAISFTALRAQLETERSSLYKIDENIKKIVQTTGRFSNDRFNNSSGDYLKSGSRVGSRHSFPDSRQNDDSFGKRKQETKTVFSRLSARTLGSDDEEPAGARARVESAVARELPSRAAALRAQAGDAQARTRNRRIFGSLLGTLHKFKQEEIVLQTKEDKKAQVERKIEEQARLQKEKEQKERKTLFAEREHKKAMIKALEAKMARVHEFEKWEASQKHLANFVLTRAKPHLYWIPKRMTDKATEKLNSSRKYHEKCMSAKRAELQAELARVEQRCLRARAAPAAKENEPHHHESGSAPARKREKFAADVDVDVDEDEKDAEDSDGDEPPRAGAGAGAAAPALLNVTGESKLDTTMDQDTTVEQNTTMEQDTTVEQNTTMDQDTTVEQNTTMDQGTTVEQDTTVGEDTTMEQDTTVEEDETREETKISVDTSDLQHTVDNPPETTGES